MDTPSILHIKVIPNASKTESAGYMDDGTWKIRIKAIPEDGKANAELLRFLKKETQKNWEIIRGTSQSRKILKQKVETIRSE